MPSACISVTNTGRSYWLASLPSAASAVQIDCCGIHAVQLVRDCVRFRGVEAGQVVSNAVEAARLRGEQLRPAGQRRERVERGRLSLCEPRILHRDHAGRSQHRDRALGRQELTSLERFRRARDVVWIILNADVVGDNPDLGVRAERAQPIICQARVVERASGRLGERATLHVATADQSGVRLERGWRAPRAEEDRKWAPQGRAAASNQVTCGAQIVVPDVAIAIAEAQNVQAKLDEDRLIQRGLLRMAGNLPFAVGDRRPKADQVLMARLQIDADLDRSAWQRRANTRDARLIRRARAIGSTADPAQPLCWRYWRRAAAALRDQARVTGFDARTVNLVSAGGRGATDARARAAQALVADGALTSRPGTPKANWSGYRRLGRGRPESSRTTPPRRSTPTPLRKRRAVIRSPAHPSSSDRSRSSLGTWTSLDAFGCILRLHPRATPPGA